MAIEWWILLPAILGSAGVWFGAGYILLKRQQPEPVELPPLQDRLPLDNLPSLAPGIETEPPSSGRYLSDQEKVVMYLEEAGGQMFQSDLVKKTDFSKSKLSMVLSDLKEKGTIQKIKKGKENLIRLNRLPGDRPDDEDETA
jgi:uncharacterized membrane protein